MLAEFTFGFLVWVATVLLIIIIGSDLFTTMVDHQAQYLRLIIDYAPFPAINHFSSNPEPVSRYLSWALGKNTDPVRCMHLRHEGKFRYGKTGRWLNVRGEAFFSLATPGFVWHAKIAYVPGLWIEAFDYYVHRQAGMNLNLCSVFPLDNAYGDKIKTSSLFRYLASAPLFPAALVPGTSVVWENVNDSTSRAVIRDANLCAEALVHFDASGRIQNIEACHTTHKETGRPVAGHFIHTFTDYIDVQGYKIPRQFSSELILPDGEYARSEYTITSIEFEIPETVTQGDS